MKFLLILTIILSSFLTLSQSAREEIEKARQKTLNQLENQQYDSIKLKTQINGESYFHLTMREQEWVFLFQKKYSELLRSIQEHEPYMYLDGYFRITDIDEQIPSIYRYAVRERSDSLAECIKSHFNDQRGDLINEINNSELNDEDRSFLNYYVQYTDYQIDICSDIKQQESLEKANNLRLNYPYSKHLNYVNLYSNHFREPSNFGLSGSFGFGYGLLSKGLKENLKMKSHLSVLMSLTYKKFDFGLVIPLSAFRTETPLEVKNWHFEEGSNANLNSIALYFGYNIELSRIIAVNPFIGTSFDNFKISNHDNEEPEFKNLNTIGLFYGLNLDIGSKEFDCRNNYRNKNFLSSNFAPFARLQIGVMNPNLSSHVAELDGSHMFFSIGFGFYIQFVKSTKISKIL